MTNFEYFVMVLFIRDKIIHFHRGIWQKNKQLFEF